MLHIDGSDFLCNGNKWYGSHLLHEGVATAGKKEWQTKENRLKSTKEVHYSLCYIFFIKRRAYFYSSHHHLFPRFFTHSWEDFSLLTQKKFDCVKLQTWHRILKPFPVVIFIFLLCFISCINVTKVSLVDHRTRGQAVALGAGAAQ